MRIYRCETCDKILLNLGEQNGTINKPEIIPGSVDAAAEKHVPVVELKSQGIVVKVGEVPHPSTAEHFIEWIEVIDAARVYRQHLKPGAEPQAFFECSAKPGLIVRTFCNLHGLWRK